MGISIEFGMPFKGQVVPPDWQWGVIGSYKPNFDYLNFAKRLVRRLPPNGPSRLAIKFGDKVLASWSRDQELEEEYWQ
jgi:hypothetical protein